MKRIDRIRNMTVEEMAKVIIKHNITDAFCDSSCGNDEECLRAVECCIKYLESEVDNNGLHKIS